MGLIMDTKDVVTQTGKSDITRGVLKRFLQVVFVMLLQAAVLFISAGRLDWVMAWVLLGVNFVSVVINGIILLRKDPALIAERAQIKEDAKQWDPPLAGIVSLVGPLSIWLVAGLNQRFGWTPGPGFAIQLVALLFLLLGYFVWGWAMVANRFFSGLVRIQKERGHTAISTGPYRLVRHPGYAGLVVFTLATSLVLGSIWALIPAVLTVITAIVRTALEDRTLIEELDGYREYAKQVRHRLLPGIW
jgi:protein-S-isoprenylcysteine O-methyltransferase Ste14